MTRWLRKHPITGFLLLTFVASYLIGTPLLMAYLAWAPAQPLILRTYLSRVFVVYGPGCASLLMTFACHGRGGVVLLLKRLIPRVSDLPWALLILAAGFGSAALALKSSGAFTAQFAEAIGAAGGLLAGHFALQILVIAVGEELGWRGWLLPRLLERVSRLRATLIVAAVWGFWHGPLLFSGMSAAALFLCSTLGLSFLFTWIWSHGSERLFLIVVAHATVNTPLFFWEQLATQRGWDPGVTPSAWRAQEWMVALAGCGLVAFTRLWWLQRVPPDMSAPCAGSMTD
jgi:membrane protease YdiL (CAAX protease family)